MIIMPVYFVSHTRLPHALATLQCTRAPQTHATTRLCVLGEACAYYRDYCKVAG